MYLVMTLVTVAIYLQLGDYFINIWLFLYATKASRYVSFAIPMCTFLTRHSIWIVAGP